MPLILTSPPTVEPVSLAEAKAQLRVTVADEDTFISGLIVSARRQAELFCGIALITQGWSLFLDRWPDGPDIAIPLWPVAAVNDLRVYGEDDIAAVIDPAHYYVDRVSRPCRLVRRGSRVWAPPGRVVNGIEIAFTAGLGASGGAVPGDIREAVLRIVADGYENRGDDARKMPLDAQGLLHRHRSLGL